MSASLMSLLNDVDSISNPSDYENFFSKKDKDYLKHKFIYSRECPPIGNPAEHCRENLFFGFFHDGTRNNLYRSLDKEDHSESNVGRLYLAYPGQGPLGITADKKVAWKHKKESFTNYFRVYTPGVGSPFTELKDSGEGLDRTMGSAFAYMGERRIVWTLVQAINNLHRYFLEKNLVSSDEVLSLCQKINLSSGNLGRMTGHYYGPDHADEPDPSQSSTPRVEFEALLRKLHQQIRYHMPDPKTGKPQNVNPGCVKEIFVSVFGFSRGATAARVFLNWLIALCRLDAQLLGKSGTTLGGFTVHVDFLGLFDSVASVGRANTLGMFNGHDAWSDAEISLRIPDEVPCLHLVAAHEVRRSFPLDSISIKSAHLADQHREIVYPGVHSDIGGGYVPKEQGKGVDAKGRDMLSRLPLAHMYREARLAGVPLKLELAEQRTRDGFLIDPSLVAAFNQYLKQCAVAKGSLTEIMREQRKLYILWRLTRRKEALVKALPLIDERPADRNDLEGANEEFEKEIEDFREWLAERRDEHGHTIAPKPQPAGFHNSSKHSEWEEVARFWEKEVLPEGMAELFDHAIHDSRAWFKLTGSEADDVEAELQEWVRKKNEDGNPQLNGIENDPLTPNQRKWAIEYERTGKIPRMPTSGRETFNGAGYLRYRRIYAGGDSMLISRIPGSKGRTHIASKEATQEPALQG